MEQRTWQARFLSDGEKRACRELWEEIFTEDSGRFLDYYDRWKYTANECYGIYDGDKLVSMVQLNPYNMQVGGYGPIAVNYIIAVATRKEYRHRGMMAALLKESLGQMRKKRMPFVFLMPAAEAIYHPFGFRYFYESSVGTLKLCTAQEGNQGSGQTLSVRLAGFADMKRLVDFSEAVQAELFDCYTKRDRCYYERLLEELKSENGGLLLLMRAGQIIASVPFWGDGPVEIREILCRPQDKEQVLFTLGRWARAGLAGKNPERLSVTGASFDLDEKKPTIMGRIVDAKSFLELFSAEEPVELFLELSDGFLGENDGLYRWNLSQDGGRAERISPLESQFLKAADLSGGGSRTAEGEIDPEIIRCTAAELFFCLMGGDKPEGVFRKVRVCQKAYINEIV